MNKNYSKNVNIHFVYILCCAYLRQQFFCSCDCPTICYRRKVQLCNDEKIYKMLVAYVWFESSDFSSSLTQSRRGRDIVYLAAIAITKHAWWDQLSATLIGVIKISISLYWFFQVRNSGLHEWPNGFYPPRVCFKFNIYHFVHIRA